jgi:plastocyanin
MNRIPKRARLLRLGIVLGTVAVGGLLGAVASWRWVEPTTRNLDIKARQYAYEPSVIRVNSGDTLRVRLASLDVVHGFYVEGHDVDAEIPPQQNTFLVRNPSKGKEWRETDELVFIAGNPGKYRFRCSHTCGTMHPFMLGELIVEPNVPLRAGLGSLAGLFVGMLLVRLLQKSTVATVPEQQTEGRDATPV